MNSRSPQRIKVYHQPLFASCHHVKPALNSSWKWSTGSWPSAGQQNSVFVKINFEHRKLILEINRKTWLSSSISANWLAVWLVKAAQSLSPLLLHQPPAHRPCTVETKINWCFYLFPSVKSSCRVEWKGCGSESCQTVGYNRTNSITRFSPRSPLCPELRNPCDDTASELFGCNRVITITQAGQEWQRGAGLRTPLISHFTQSNPALKLRPNVLGKRSANS